MICAGGIDTEFARIFAGTAAPPDAPVPGGWVLHCAALSATFALCLMVLLA